ncbi:hypothetical protein [Rhodanobacter sp. Soil772]|uniref:AbiJ-NTD4 domain-containing protein n=1 Tax=Rhodanobacter sp. Soil772 TaxID=1736406 RepID=UPI0009E79174|nr:hypothetical protein [Rhodanobacter sp. Soil772]
MSRFSERNGLYPPDAEITARHEAPEALRATLIGLAYRSGLKPSDLRRLVCDALFLAPDANNWSETPNIDEEVRGYLRDCDWFHAYDIIEIIYRYLVTHPNIGAFLGDVSGLHGHALFEGELNRYFRFSGLGWQLSNGIIEYRGTEVFEDTLQDAAKQLNAVNRHTSAYELHEAIRDLSRRPEPDVTGAIQHAMAALECVARDVGESKDTLGTIVSRRRDLFPAPLDIVVEKAWGWSSNFGRHLQEGKSPSIEEAELLVGISGSLCRYFASKLK